MSEVLEVFTPEQLAKARQLLKIQHLLARSIFVTEVMADMDPPPGVVRTFDKEGRVLMYGGYRATTLALALFQELTATGD